MTREQVFWQNEKKGIYKSKTHIQTLSHLMSFLPLITIMHGPVFEIHGLKTALHMRYSI